MQWYFVFMCVDARYFKISHPPAKKYFLTLLQFTWI